MDETAELGARLRAARRTIGFTLDDVAEATGLTRSFVAKVERDEATPSVKTLVAICGALGVDIGLLFAAPYTRHVAKDAQPMTPRRSAGDLREYLLTPFNHAPVQIIHAHIGPGTGSRKELNSVPAESQTLYVMRGRVTLRFTTESVEVNEGESMTFHGYEPHGWSNDSEDPAEVIWVLAPTPWTASRQAVSQA